MEWYVVVLHDSCQERNYERNNTPVIIRDSTTKQ